MSSSLKKKAQKMLANAKFLMAVCSGENERDLNFSENGADMNFVDTDGNTVLHYAVDSQNFKVVELVLTSKEKDVSAQNSENESALDIARKLGNNVIIELLGSAIVNNTFKLLKDTVDVKTRRQNSVPSSTLSPAEREIQKTKDKIKYCFQSIELLNKSLDTSCELSHEQANAFVCFLELFSLEGSCVEDIKAAMKQTFSRYFSEEDRERISKTHARLKRPAKLIRLEDVRKIIKEDIKPFFEKLKNYVKHVVDEKDSDSNETKLCSFLNELQQGDQNLGEEIGDVRSFVMEELKKLVVAAYNNKPMTQEDFFNFTMNFYPAFQTETAKKCEIVELRKIRNKFVHEFHKYGCAMLGNEIHNLRSKIFHYYYAQEVYAEFNAMQPDVNYAIIRKNLERKLEDFKVEFRSEYEKKRMMPQGDVETPTGYELVQSVFPAKDDARVEVLVDEYSQFMLIFDCERSDEDYSDEGIHDGNHDSEQQKELNDVERRQIFEKFGRLKKIKKHCPKIYDEEMQKMRDELITNYRINGDYFDNVCRSYVANNDEWDEKDKRIVQKITKTISNLKKIKDNYKLSYQVLISLCNHLIEKKEISDSKENLRCPQDIDPKIFEEIKKEISGNEIFKITVGGKKFQLSTGNVIYNMLKTFYNEIHTYRLQFNMEDIFLDETFLNYLIMSETEEVTTKNFVEQYFTFMPFIKQCCNIEQIKGVFEQCIRLKKSKIHLDDKDYDKEKQQVKNELVSLGINSDHFQEVCRHKYIENHYKLQEMELNQIKNVENIMDQIQKLGLSLEGNISLYRASLEEGGKIDLNAHLNLLKYKNMGKRESIKKNLEGLYNTHKLKTDEISITIGTDSFKMYTRDFVLKMLETFKTRRQLKSPSHTHMVIRKLLNVEFFAPYIVRLMEKVRNDDIIERNDIAKLVQILSRKNGLYVHHLNAILLLKSGKINLYDVFICAILEQGLNIESMKVIFQEPQHLQQILRILCEKIEDNGEQRNEIVELTKNILELLNTIAYELYHSRNYEQALNILEKIQRINEQLVHNQPTENNNLLMIVVKCQIARIKNQRGQMQTDEGSRRKLHKEALSEFYSLKDILLKEKNSEEKRNIQFLLVLAEIAYTNHLLKNYEKSCDDHKSLYEKVRKFVFELPGTESLQDILTTDIYIFENSKKYQTLLSFSIESKKYLDVWKIRHTVAYNKYLLGEMEFRNKNYVNIRKHCEEALKVFKEEYNYRKRNQGQVGDLVPVLKHVAFVYDLLAQLRERNNESQEALLCHYTSLEKSNEYFQVQKDIFWPNNAAVLKTRRSLLYSLGYIAFAYSRIGTQIKNEDSTNYFNKSLKIDEQLYQMWVQQEGELYKKTLSTMLSIGLTYMHCGKLLEAKTKVLNIFEIQPCLYSNDDPAVAKFRNKLINTSTTIAEKFNQNRTKEDSEHAKKLYQKVSDIRKQSLKKDYESERTVTALGEPSVRSGMSDTAKEVQERVPAYQKQRFGRDREQTDETPMVIDDVRKPSRKRKYPDDK